ncbi:MAG: hypothetical protein IT381_08755 [Deltaproteobacteria bacterium]|nr:hypothetical protein [Deltaproteobacteria bacterium]
MTRKLLPFAALFLACAPLTGSIRAVTYAPTFHYIPRAELRTTMWLLAGDVVELENLLQRPAPLVVGKDVVDRLSLMQAHAATLDGKPTNHPKIDEHLDDFRRAVTAAKLAAEADPPNYYLAGALTGSCTSCHNSR